jgi:hypothetical protein
MAILQSGNIVTIIERQIPLDDYDATSEQHGTLKNYTHVHPDIHRQARLHVQSFFRREVLILKKCNNPQTQTSGRSVGNTNTNASFVSDRALQRYVQCVLWKCEQIARVLQLRRPETESRWKR